MPVIAPGVDKDVFTATRGGCQVIARNLMSSLLGEQEFFMAATESQKLKLTFVTETYPPEINGVANTLFQLVEGMWARGHSIQLIRPSQGRDDRERRRARLEEVKVPGFTLPMYRQLRTGVASPVRLRRALAGFQPDALYVATEGPLGHTAIRIARDLKIPVISGYHTNFDQYSRAYGFGILKPVIERYLKRFHAGCVSTLVPTRALAELLVKKGYGNVEVFARGVDTELFSPARRSQELRAAWGVDEDTLLVSYVGRIAAEKNLDLLVRSYRRMQAVAANMRLVLVGAGPEVRRLKKQNPDFIFTGVRRGEELAAHYASSDLFMFPSLTETFGNVIIEAMASGLPILSYEYAAGQEHVESGRNGLLVPPGDESAFVQAGVDLITRRNELAAMGRRSREIAEGITWDRLHDRMEHIIRGHLRSGEYHEFVTAS